MRVEQASFRLYSPHCEIQIDLAEVFHIRIEQQVIHDHIHTVLEGRHAERDVIFKLSAPGVYHYHLWTKLIKEAELSS